jgi:D-serine deaminase-like pyridoxal phosphate-dependent protein
MTTAPVRLSDILTPAAIIDLDRLERNCARMLQRARDLGVSLRPHLKTAKSAEVARLATGGQGPITVSTLSEIDYFARAGFKDITYSVGIAAAKIPELARLHRDLDVTINLVADSVVAVRAVGEAAGQAAASFPVFIEIDCGSGRGGVDWDGPELLEIAGAIATAPALSLAGVLTHAGHSYDTGSVAEIERIAEDERLAVIRAAERLRTAGFTVPVVSVGSTPTATFARSLEGVTEMRPGVYTFQDLAQAALGVCAIDDIAVSVLTTVIGDNPRSDRLLIDAGGLALSKDLSADRTDSRFGYGLVCPSDGRAPLDGVRVTGVHQEHGFVAGAGVDRAIGTRLRVLPNHACMTVAPYQEYHVVRGASEDVIAVWDKAIGWTAPAR